MGFRGCDFCLDSYGDYAICATCWNGREDDFNALRKQRDELLAFVKRQVEHWPECYCDWEYHCIRHEHLRLIAACEEKQ